MNMCITSNMHLCHVVTLYYYKMYKWFLKMYKSIPPSQVVHRCMVRCAIDTFKNTHTSISCCQSDKFIKAIAHVYLYIKGVLSPSNSLAIHATHATCRGDSFNPLYGNQLYTCPN